MIYKPRNFLSMKRLFQTRAPQWKRYSSILLLFFFLALQKNTFAQQYSNITVSWVGVQDRNHCNCGDVGVACSWSRPFNSQPDARFKLYTKLSTDATYAYDIYRKNNDNCGSKSFNTTQLTRTNTCATDINFTTQAWEENACGADDQFNQQWNCVNDDNSWTAASFNIPFQTYPQGVDNNYTFTLPGGLYSVTVRFKWSAVSGYTAPALENANLVLCSPNTGTLKVTSALTAPGNTFRWYSDATLTTVIGTGATLTVSSPGNYYVAEWNGTCNGAVNHAAVTAGAVPAAPTVNPSSLSVCKGSVVTLQATNNAPGASLEWYNNAAGLPSQLIGLGASISPTINNDVTFYVCASNGNCKSSLVPINITLTTALALPVVSTPVSTCVNGQPILSASTGGGGGIFNWYTLPLGGSSIWNGEHYQTYPITTSTTFYVSESSLGGGCESDRVAIVVNPDLSTIAPTATATPSSICLGGGTTLTANSNNGGEIYWYSDAALSNLMFIGNPFQPQNINANTSYYFVEKQGVCISNTGLVNVTIGSNLNAPTAANVTACEGEDATLTASCNGEIRWYSDVALTNLLHVGSTLPVLTPAVGTTIYYATCSVGGQCESTATPVSLIVNPGAGAIALSSNSPVCEGRDIILTSTAIAGATYDWFGPSSAYLGSTSTPSYIVTHVTTSMSGTYSVEAKIGQNGCPSTASTNVTVDVVGVAPTAADVTVCEGEDATLTVSCNGETRWYSDVALTNLLHVGSTLPVLTPAVGTTTYYATCSEGGQCESTATPVSLIVNPGAGAIALSSNSPVCAGGSIVLTTTAIAGATYNWYGLSNALLGTTTTPSYTINNATTSMSGTYSVEAKIGQNGCPSTASTNVTVGAAGAAPTAADVTVCEGEDATLTASCNGEIRWYSDVALTNLLHVGSTLPVLTPAAGTTIYYATCSVGGQCESTATPVSLIVNPGAGAIALSSNSPVCEGGSIVLTTTAIAGATYNWYGLSNALLGTTTTPSYTINNATTSMSGTYSVEAKIGQNGCPSTASTNVTVGAAGVAPSAKSTTICEGQSARLTAYGSAGAILTWYDDQALTHAIQVGAEYVTPALMNTATYYVAETGACATAATAVKVTVNPKPEKPSTEEGYYVTCWDDFTVLYASNDAGDDIHWYMDSEGKNEVTGYFGYDDNGEFTTPEIASFTRFYFDAVNPETECHSDMNFVDVYTTPQFQAPKLDDVSICTTDKNITLKAHVTYPMDLVSDFYDIYTFNQAVVQFTDNTGTDGGALTTLGLVTAPLDPWNYVYEGVVELTIPRVGVGPFGESYDYSSPGTYDIGAIVNNSWYNMSTYDLFNCTSDFGTATLNIKDISTAPEAKDVTVCEGDNATLTASCNGEIRWYSDRTLKDLLHVGSTMPVLAPAVGTTTYFATCTAPNSCESSATPVNLIVTPKPSAIVLKSNSPVCEGVDITFTATAINVSGVSYTWYAPNGDVLGTTTEPTFTLNNTTTSMSGTYTVKVTIGQNNSCAVTASTDVVIKPTPVAPSVPEKTTVCEKDDVTLCASSKIPGALYIWSGPNGFAAEGKCITLSKVTTDLAGSYSVTVTVDGCTSAPSTVTLIVNSNPVAEIGSNAPICEHSTLELHATLSDDDNNEYTFKWTGPMGYTSTEQNPKIENVTEANNQGFYTCTITNVNTGCKASFTTLVDIYTFPDRIIADNNGPVCEGGSIKLNATAVFGAHYTWTAPNDGQQQGQVYQSDYPVTSVTLENVTPSQSGTYTLTVTIPGGVECSETTTTDVVIWTNPIANAGVDTSVMQGVLLQLNGTSNTGIIFNWSPEEYLNHNNVPNPLFYTDVIPEHNPYPLVFTVWDKNGCMDKDTVEITVKENLVLNIPDIITPNGDGLNDTWIIDHIDNLNKSEIPYMVQIYARGGALLFSTKTYDNTHGFDGTYKGTALPDGAYWYIITTPNKTFKGALHIKR
jgi:gliding motility-associated-like protein